MPAAWGYARVSTVEQDPALQVDALRAAGVPEANIIVETISGGGRHKPALAGLPSQGGRRQVLGRKPRLSPHQRREAARMIAAGSTQIRLVTSA